MMSRSMIPAYHWIFHVEKRVCEGCGVLGSFVGVSFGVVCVRVCVVCDLCVWSRFVCLWVMVVVVVLGIG